MEFINQLIQVPSTDPDDARRRKLLNILLTGLGVLTILALLWEAIYRLSNLAASSESSPLYANIIGLLIGIAIIFVINRYWAGALASSLFLLLITAVFALSDTPEQVVAGRSLFLLAIPIPMASVLLRPYASFMMTGVISLLLIAISLNVDLVPDMISVLGFLVLALVSWLSARSLEQALKDLRVINRELDQRVDERTRDLAEALSKNQAILQDIADGVIVFDNAGQAIVANPAIGALTARPTHEIIGQDIKTLLGQDVSAEDREKVINLFQGHETLGSGVRFEWGDKTLSVNIATVRTNPDEIVGTVAVFRDFTHEAEIERMKDSFVSMVSHDLRTPLSAIRGYTDMLQHAVYGPLSEQQLDVMTRIHVNTGRLLNMVNNLLDQARLDAGKLSLHIQPFDPHKLIVELESVVGVLAQSQGLELSYHIADDVPATLYGDRKRLHQILVNLVNNAIKFTSQGTIGVRIYQPDAEHWAIDVSDTGSGIPDEAQARIFAPFQQIDSSITREHSGVGLGLAIVKQLTSLMEGQIELDSEPGRGSTFSIILPSSPKQEETK
jgi:PAS domain S-box-containing protein